MILVVTFSLRLPFSCRSTAYPWVFQRLGRSMLLNSGLWSFSARTRYNPEIVREDRRSKLLSKFQFLSEQENETRRKISLPLVSLSSLGTSWVPQIQLTKTRDLRIYIPVRSISFEVLFYPFGVESEDDLVGGNFKSRVSIYPDTRTDNRTSILQAWRCIARFMFRIPTAISSRIPYKTKDKKGIEGMFCSLGFASVRATFATDEAQKVKYFSNPFLVFYLTFIQLAERLKPYTIEKEGERERERSWSWCFIPVTRFPTAPFFFDHFVWFHFSSSSLSQFYWPLWLLVWEKIPIIIVIAVDENLHVT